MTTYFNDIRTLDELKAEYRRLALKYHPDHGGNGEIMKAINAEHDKLFETLKKCQNERADADPTGATHHTTETAGEFRAIIEALLHLDGLTVELCGCWIWISGDTYAHRDALKLAGCQWSKSKKKWYWRHPEDGAHFSRGKISMHEIRTKYGSQLFDAAGREADRLETATA